MKRIITVIFFGILTYTVAQKSVCQNSLPRKGDLNVQNFFTGNWYVTHIKDGGKEAACREFKFRLDKSLVKLNADGQYTLNGQTKHYTTTCSTTNGGSKGTDQYLLYCRHSYKDGSKDVNIFFDFGLTVIDTDYTNYALVHRCTKYSSLDINTGNLLLLQRNKNDNGSKATASLSKNKLSLGDFKKTSAC
uniref:Putative salivary lipocalin n=1 Tax=Panstrongylus lignarius TaxID=156445 RepID=A0A224XLA0_9HEMI